MKKILLILGGLWLAFCFTSRAAAMEPSFQIGAGSADSLTLDFRLAHNFDPWLEDYHYELAPFVDGGATWWRHGGRDEDVYGLSASAGLRLDFFLVAPVIAPYVAASVGPTLISDDEFIGRQFGSHLLINIRGTIGLRFGSNLQHDVGFNLTHYSNPFVAGSNDGYSTMSLSYNYWF